MPQVMSYELAEGPPSWRRWPLLIPSDRQAISAVVVQPPLPRGRSIEKLWIARQVLRAVRAATQASQLVNKKALDR